MSTREGNGMQVDPCKWSYAGDDSHREFVVPGPFKKDGVSGKKICMDCCRFLGWQWADKPATTNQEKPKGTYPKRDLVYLMQTKAAELNDWERKFIDDLSKRTLWSEKQEAAFNKIRAKFFDVSHLEKKDESNEKRSEQPAPAAQPIDDDFYVPF